MTDYPSRARCSMGDVHQRRGARAAALALCLLLVACSRRSEAPSPPSSSGPSPLLSAPLPPATASAAPRAAAPSSAHLRLRPPLAAAYRDSELFIAGTEDDGDRVVVTRAPAAPGFVERAAVVRKLDTVQRASEIEVFSGNGGVAVLVSISPERGGTKVLHRFQAHGAEPLSALNPVSLDHRASVCGTLDGIVYTAPVAPRAAREEDGFKPSPGRALFARYSPETPTLALPSALLATGLDDGILFCGPHRVFLWGGDRIAVWAPSERAGQLLRLPSYSPPNCPTYVRPSADDDTLFEARTDCGGELEIRSWQPPSGARMLLIHGVEDDSGDALDGTSFAFGVSEVSATQNFAGIVGFRQRPSADVPPWNESPKGWLDRVIEVMVLDRKTGRTLVVGPDLQRWLPRREIGPLLVKWMGSKLIVAWVRGYEGFGYAVLDPASTAVAPVHVDVPETGLAFAGCDMARCYAIALSRGDGAPEPVLNDEPGVAQVFAFPQTTAAPPAPVVAP